VIVLTSSTQGRAWPPYTDRNFRYQRLAGALAILCDSGAASASGEVAPGDIFSPNGFGTVGVVHSSEDRADFTDSDFKPNGAGFTHSWSNDVYTAFGAQVAARFNSQLFATVLVISEQRFDNTYRPYIDWANFKYRITPDASTRVGRTVLSTFLFSDSRDVGFSSPRVRQPLEVYDLIPILNSDGVDASYKLRTGKIAHTVLLTCGKSDETLPGNGDSFARHQWNLFDTIEYGFAIMHVAYQQAALTIDALKPFAAALESLGSQGVALADKYGSDAKRVTLFSVGGISDSADWFLTGRWRKAQYHSLLGTSTAWYASAGYRFRKLAPFLTFDGLKIDGNTSDPGVNLTQILAPLLGLATQLNAVLNGYLGSAAAQNSTSFGMRWDVHRNMDLKVQFDHTRHNAGSPGTLINLQPDFRPGGIVNLISVAGDFVS
jgi:hypothetical protein